MDNFDMLNPGNPMNFMSPMNPASPISIFDDEPVRRVVKYGTDATCSNPDITWIIIPLLIVVITFFIILRKL